MRPAPTEDILSFRYMLVDALQVALRGLVDRHDVAKFLAQLAQRERSHEIMLVQAWGQRQYRR